ncbi:hypothetical protein MMC12_005531 [Toensbergia leucococca]|nr:hypothetical protein [Toensbergia leucococca]
MSSQQDLPVGQTKPNEEEGETGPTKNALKKAQKEEKKAREKAEKAARIEAQEKQKRDEAEANDTSKGKYGPLVLSSPGPAIVDLIDIHPGIEGEVVTAWARVENARVQSAKLAFLVLRQGGESIQAVVAGGGQHQISRQMVKWSGSINTESIVRVTGLVKRTEEEVKSASLGSVELHVEQLFEEAQAAEKLPTQYKDCLRTESESESQGLPIVSLSTRLDNPVIDKRTPANRAIFKLQSAISYLFLEYMEKHDFTLIHSSKIVGTATEGGADVFEMNYFDKPAYLTQSPQIFKQMAISMDMERVCEIGPVFRAEKSNTHRHVAEFTGLDFEMVIKNHYHEVLSFGESLMIHILRSLQTNPKYTALISTIEKTYPGAGNFKLPPGDTTLRLTFAEAVDLLNEAGILNEAGEKCGPYDDFSTRQEKALGAIILQKHNTDFYTIDAFPLSLRPFYTHPSSPLEDPNSPPPSEPLSNSYDFFLRGQEIMSGAQRIHKYADLRAAMRAKGLDPDNEGFKDYLEAFRCGCWPHGGGGLGLNRILQFFLNLSDVRMATLFPRDQQRLAP